MKIKINYYLVIIFLFFFNNNLLSLDKNQITDTEKFGSQIETLNWQNLSEPKEFFLIILVTLINLVTGPGERQ